MAIKTLSFDLGTFRVQQDGVVLYQYAAGWYVDPATGQRVYYDPGTQKFYTMAGLVYIPMGYMNPAPKQVTLGIGDRLRITMSFKYSGPAVSNATCYYSIGVYGAFGFDEKMVGQNSKALSQSTTPVSYTDSYTFTIPSNVGSDWDDIYCKIFGGSPSISQVLFGYENALVLAGLRPTITDFAISDFAKV